MCLSTLSEDDREGHEYIDEDAAVETTRDEASARAFYGLISDTIAERDQEVIRRIAAEEAVAYSFEEAEGLKLHVNKLNAKIVRMMDEPRASVESDPKRSAWTGKDTLLGNEKKPTIRQWTKEVRGKSERTLITLKTRMP